MNKNRLYVLAAVAALGSCGTAKAQLTITPIFNDGDVNNYYTGDNVAPISSLSDASTVEAGITQAINQITSNIQTANPVNISINFLSDPTGLGSSNSPLVQTTYGQYEAELAALPNQTAADLTARTSLALQPYAANTPVVITATNALAIGDPTAPNINVTNSGVIGTVALNFDLLADSRATQTSSQYDLIATVAHEVDEILGIGGQGSTLGRGFATGEIASLDPFRYSAPGVRTTSSTGAAYFSIDGGLTNLVNFNQSSGGDRADWGDGAIPPDGSSNVPGQVQDAFQTNGTQANIGKNEVLALDVVGYTPTASGLTLEGEAVPEPSTYALVLGGLAALFVYRRRQRA